MLLWQVTGGTIVGGAVEGAAILLLRRLEDPQAEVIITVVAAYGSYLLADVLHASGFLAVLVGGLLIGNLGRSWGMSPPTRQAVDTSWQVIDFALNGVLFLLIGLAVPPGGLVAQGGLIADGFAIVVAARLPTAYLLPQLLRRKGSPWRWRHVLWWGGARGPLSVALALALNDTGLVPAQLVTVAYGVALCSIVIQGATIAPLAGWLLGTRPPVHTRRSSEGPS
jgi:CPA1 family monovalent cation:H+ antiporter